MEDIFRMSVYYKDQAEKALSNLKNIFVIDEEVLQVIMSQNRIMRRITNLQRNSRFKSDINYYRKYKAYLDNENKRLVTKIELIVDDRVRIRNKKMFETLLNVCEENYLQSPVTTTAFVSSRKETLK